VPSTNFSPFESNLHMFPISNMDTTH
jgi:hypothetical protein